MKRVIDLIATLVMLAVAFVGINAVSGSAAQADGVGHNGQIKHYSPDSGYDNSILIRCDRTDDRTQRFLAEGRDSRDVCGADTDDVYVRVNEELWCLNISWVDSYGVAHWNWKLKFDAQGWHELNGILFDDGRGCTLRRD